jgi:mRNA-degrading endonuclease RelE of RelBE toxin-antitoxin system
MLNMVVHIVTTGLYRVKLSKVRLFAEVYLRVSYEIDDKKATISLTSLTDLAL